MLSLERLNILLHAYDQTKRVNLHITTPVQDAAGIASLKKIQASNELSNINKRE
jgi:hypothetical protein